MDTPDCHLVDPTFLMALNEGAAETLHVYPNGFEARGRHQLHTPVMQVRTVLGIVFHNSCVVQAAVDTKLFFVLREL